MNNQKKLEQLELEKTKTTRLEKIRTTKTRKIMLVLEQESKLMELYFEEEEHALQKLNKRKHTTCGVSN